MYSRLPFLSTAKKKTLSNLCAQVVSLKINSRLIFVQDGLRWGKVFLHVGTMFLSMFEDL